MTAGGEAKTAILYLLLGTDMENTKRILKGAKGKIKDAVKMKA